MSVPQDRPTAPVASDGDQPPPYSAVMGGASYTTPAAPGGYPQMGFVTTPHTGAVPAASPVHQPTPSAGYPHPAGGYPHPVQGTVYVEQRMLVGGAGGAPMSMNVIVAPPVGSDPSTTYCTSCQQQITTRVDYRTSWHTHIIAGIICFSTMFFSMCCLGLVPYCFDSCKNAEHYCPNCNAYIGKYERY